MGFLERKFLGAAEGSVVNDVVRNIGYLLRAKRGAASFRPEFGLTETGFRTGEEMLVVMDREIRENLAAFEPRVEVVEISEEYEADSQRPRLVVHCRLRGRAEAIRLTLDPRSREIAVLPGTAP